MRHPARLALAALVLGCRSAPAAPPRAPVAAPPAPRTVQVTVRANPLWPEGSAEGRLALGWLTQAEWRKLSRGEMSPVVEVMGRFQVTTQRLGASAVTVPMTTPPWPDLVVLAVFDTQRRFLETLFGQSVQGNALGNAPVHGTSATLYLETQGAAPAAPERCTGERLELVTVDAPEVRGTLGNSTSRRLCVRLPRSYAAQPTRRYPVVYVLPGIGGTDAVLPNSLASLTDRVPREALYVGVDTSTLAGSSYLVDSERTGAWERYLTERVVATVDGRYRTLPGARARALAGHSTGGFDAVSLAFRRPEVFGAVGGSSPDALDFGSWFLGPDGRADPLWLGWVRTEEAVGGAGQFTSYGADWSPDPREPRGFAWPVDLTTGELRAEVWSRWLRQSPVTWLQTPEGLARARALQGRIYLTCGRADEARLFAPTERFASALRAAGIDHVWTPTEWGHLGHRAERWLPLLGHLTAVMPPAAP